PPPPPQTHRTRRPFRHQKKKQTQVQPRPRLYRVELCPQNFSTSSRVGMDGCAPARVTETALAAVAKRALSIADLPIISATAKAPLNASPAAGGSTAVTLNASICWREPSLAAKKAPRAPLFSSTPLLTRPPPVSSVSIASGEPVAPGGRHSVISVSLGVSQLTSPSNPAGNGRAGAGSRSNGTLAWAQSPARRSTDSNGISSCASTAPASRITPAFDSTSCGRTGAFAPGATTIAFSPFGATA